MRLRERAADVGFAAGWAAVKALPEPVVSAAFRAGADRAARRGGSGAARLRANLRRVRPGATEVELAALTRRGLRSYARYWQEAFRLPVIGPDRIRTGTDFRGADVLDKAIADGRGAICALPHMGNWDAAGAWLVDHGARFTTVAERLKPESLYRRFLDYRESLGMEVVPLTGGDRPPSDVLAERLRAGGVVCLLGDRDLTKRGIDVTFFGETARMPAGPALLAATTGAALLPVGLWFTPTGWVVRVHPPIALAGTRLREKVTAATQVLADTYAAEIAEHPEDWHMLQRLWVADLDPARGRPGRDRGIAVRIGLVCPYSWDIPGGVQAHVRDLAEALLAMGHQVSVLAPADDETPLPPYVVGAGRAVPVRYNGSVARLQFGPVSARRVRRWLRDGEFDVLHVHEPVAPSLSLLAVMQARGPIVATFHTSTTRSRSLSAAQSMLQPFLERIRGRIAVSAAARQVQVEHLGGDAVEIPNGVAVAHYAGAPPLPGYPRAGGTVGFVGRYDEPRKGMPVLLAALAALAPHRPGLRLLVAGRGDADDLLDGLPAALAGRVDLLGQVSEADKARMLRSVDVYCAPNLGGESFGIILLEAMAASAPIAASDLDAFRRVLDDGRAGALFPTGDPAALARVLGGLLDDRPRREALAAAGREVVADYDWPVVARQVLAVYETVIAAVPVRVTAEDAAATTVPPDLVGEDPDGLL